MIKNFKQYINEGGSWDEEEEYDNLLNALDGALEKFGRKWSYSSMAGHNQNMAADISKFDGILSGMGWGKDRVKSVMEKQNWDELPDNLLCGVIDAYMHSMNKEYVLAGYSIDGDPRENLIKFAYGWHKSSYGKAWLEQNGITGEFEETMPEKIEAFINDNLEISVKVTKSADSFSIECENKKDAGEVENLLADYGDAEASGVNVGFVPKLG